MPRPVSSKLRGIVNLPKDFRDEVLKCVNILYLCVKSNLFQLGKEVFCDMKQTREYILSEIKTFLHTADPNARVMLFGSRARDDAREDSDWDILILIEKEKVRNEDFDNIAYPLIELGWNIGEMINPVLYTFSEWEKRSFTIFHKNVEEEGIAL